MTNLSPVPFKVADLSLAEFGRKEIELAEHEMPGLMAMRAEYARQPAAGRRPRHRLAAHDRADRRADRDAHRARRAGALGQLQHLLHPGPRRGRGRRRARRARSTTPRACPVFAWKGETLEEYWWCTEQALLWPGEGGPNMILDDGGDATLLVHKGVEFEKAGAVPDPSTADSEEFAVVLDRARPAAWPRTPAAGPRSPTASRASPRRRRPACTASSRWPGRASCSSRPSTSTTR